MPDHGHTHDHGQGHAHEHGHAHEPAAHHHGGHEHGHAHAQGGHEHAHAHGGHEHGHAHDAHDAHAQPTGKGCAGLAGILALLGLGLAFQLDRGARTAHAHVEVGQPARITLAGGKTPVTGTLLRASGPLVVVRTEEGQELLIPRAEVTSMAGVEEAREAAPAPAPSAPSAPRQAQDHPQHGRAAPPRPSRAANAIEVEALWSRAIEAQTSAQWKEASRLWGQIDTLAPNRAARRNLITCALQAFHDSGMHLAQKLAALDECLQPLVGRPRASPELAACWREVAAWYTRSIPMGWEDQVETMARRIEELGAEHRAQAAEVRRGIQSRNDELREGMKGGHGGHDHGEGEEHEEAEPPPPPPAPPPPPPAPPPPNDPPRFDVAPKPPR